MRSASQKSYYWGWGGKTGGQDHQGVLQTSEGEKVRKNVVRLGNSHPRSFCFVDPAGAKNLGLRTGGRGRSAEALRKNVWQTQKKRLRARGYSRRNDQLHLLVWGAKSKAREFLGKEERTTPMWDSAIAKDSREISEIIGKCFPLQARPSGINTTTGRKS